MKDLYQNLVETINERFSFTEARDIFEAAEERLKTSTEEAPYISKDELSEFMLHNHRVTVDSMYAIEDHFKL